MILDAWGWCTGTTQRDGMGEAEKRKRNGIINNKKTKVKISLKTLTYNKHSELVPYKISRKVKRQSNKIN